MNQTRPPLITPTAAACQAACAKEPRCAEFQWIGSECAAACPAFRKDSLRSEKPCLSLRFHGLPSPLLPCSPAYCPASAFRRCASWDTDPTILQLAKNSR